MLNPNLLSPEEKQDLALIFKRRAVIAVGGGLTAILVIFSVLLLPTVFMQVAEKSELLRIVGIERERREKTGLDKKSAAVKKVNRLTEKILGYNRGYRRVFPLFESVIGEVPPSIGIESIRLRNTAGEVSVSGLSATREDLLKFRDALDKNPGIEKVFLPVTDLIKERNIRFSLTAKLKQQQP